MKKIIVLGLLISCIAGYSQPSVPRSSAAITPLDYRLQVVRDLGIPNGPTPTLNGGLNLPGKLFYNVTDSSLYTYNGNTWDKVGGLSGIFNQFLVKQPASFRISGSGEVNGGFSSNVGTDISSVRIGINANPTPNSIYVNIGGNTAIGWEALFANNEGWQNTGVGAQTLYENRYGEHNTAIGTVALTHVNPPNMSGGGSYNTAVGSHSGEFTTIGSYNVYLGKDAGNSNTTGSGNVFIGSGAGSSLLTYPGLTTGHYNIIIGYRGGQGNVYGSMNKRILIGNKTVDAPFGTQVPFWYGNMEGDSTWINSLLKIGNLPLTTDTNANANIIVVDVNNNLKKMNRSLIRGTGTGGSSGGGEVPAVLNVQTLLSYPYYDVPTNPNNRPAGNEKIIKETSGRYKANDGGGASYIWCDTCAFAKDANGNVLYDYNGNIMAYDSVLSLKPYAVSGAGRWNLLYDGVINARKAGLKSDPTLAFNNLPYIKNLLSAAKNTKEVWLPEGLYPYADSFSIRYPINIRGVRDKSILQVASNHIGFFMAIGASESFFQDIVIQCDNGNGNVASTNMWQHGVVSRGITRMRGVRIQFFGSCAIDLTANLYMATTDHDYGNTSNSSFENCSFYYNGWHGVKIQGDDASNMYFQSCDFRTNGGAGYWSMGFLGNSGAVNHTASNTARAGNKSVVKVGGNYYCLMIFMQSFVNHNGKTYRVIADHINKEPGVVADSATYWVFVPTFIRGLDEWSASGNYIRQRQPGVDAGWELYWAKMPGVEFDGPDYTPAWDATALHLNGGSYIEANGNGFGVHTGDYSEGGQGPNYFGGQNMALGGDQAAGWWGPGSNGKPGTSASAYMGKQGGTYYFPGGVLADAVDQNDPANPQPEYVMGFYPPLGMGVKEGNNNYDPPNFNNWISPFWLVEKYDKPNRRFIKQYANSPSWSPYFTTTLYTNKNILDRDTLSNGGVGYVGNERFAAKMAFAGFFNYKETTGGYAYWGATGNLTPPPTSKWKIGDIMIYQGADTNYLMIKNRIEGFPVGSSYGTAYRWDTIYTGNWAKKNANNISNTALTFNGSYTHNAAHFNTSIDSTENFSIIGRGGTWATSSFNGFQTQANLNWVRLMAGRLTGRRSEVAVFGASSTIGYDGVDISNNPYARIYAANLTGNSNELQMFGDSTVFAPLGVANRIVIRNLLRFTDTTGGGFSGKPLMIDYTGRVTAMDHWMDFGNTDFVAQGDRYHNWNAKSFYLDNMSNATLRLINSSNNLRLVSKASLSATDSSYLRLNRGVGSSGFVELGGTRLTNGTGIFAGWTLSTTAFQPLMKAIGVLNSGFISTDTSNIKLSVGLNNLAANTTINLYRAGDSVTIRSGRLFFRDNASIYPDTSTFKPIARDPITGEIKTLNWWFAGGGAGETLVFDNANGPTDLDTISWFPSLTPITFQNKRIGVTAGTRTTVTRTAYGDSALRYQVNVIVKDLGSNSPCVGCFLRADSTWQLPGSGSSGIDNQFAVEQTADYKIIGRAFIRGSSGNTALTVKANSGTMLDGLDASGNNVFSIGPLGVNTLYHSNTGVGHGYYEWGDAASDKYMRVSNGSTNAAGSAGFWMDNDTKHAYVRLQSANYATNPNNLLIGTDDADITTKCANTSNTIKFQIGTVTKLLISNTAFQIPILAGGSVTRMVTTDPSGNLSTGTIDNYTSTTQTGSSYTVAVGIRTVFVNYTGGTATITLPSAASFLDRRITIRNVHASNNVTVSGVVTGDANTLLGREAIELQSDGTDWYIVSFKQ